MKRESKFIKIIKDPGKWLWAFYGGLLLTVGAIIAVAILWNGANPVIYALYAVLLALFIYCLVFTIKYGRKFIRHSMLSHRFTSRLVEDYGFRTLFFSAASFVINVAYVLYQTIMAIINRSMWYGTFAVYYALLSLVRGVAVWADVRAGRRYKEDEAALLKSKLHCYLLCGMLIILLSAALSVALGYMISNDISFRYGGATLYVMVAFAFYKVISSAINLSRAKKFNDYGVQSMRNIKFTEALVSIFAMQTALIAAFGSGDDGSLGVLNSVMAVLICLFTLGLGIYMIVKSAVVLKNGERGGGAGGAAV